MMRRLSMKNRNPIANVFVVIVGALAIGASIVLGFFAFVALSGVILMMATVIGVRVWWISRKLRRASPVRDHASARANAPGVIEGEYRVVGKDHDEA